MRRPNKWEILAVVLVVAPVFYFLVRFLYPNIANLFLEAKPFDEFMGNILTTVVGVVAGVLMALDIERRKQEDLEKRAEQQRQAEEANQKSKILELLKQELTYNKTALSDRKLDDHQTAIRLIIENRLRDESWKALSDGGELEWIKDSQLISVIAIAYNQIRGMDFLEEKYLHNFFSRDLAMLGDIHERHRVQKEKVIREINTALSNIEETIPTKQLPLGYHD